MKVLVDVLIPATGTVYNMWIPNEATVNQVLDQIKDVVVKMHETAFIPDEHTVLCAEDGSVFDVNMQILRCGIGNGSRLMLI